MSRRWPTSGDDEEGIMFCRIPPEIEKHAFSLPRLWENSRLGKEAIYGHEAQNVLISRLKKTQKAEKPHKRREEGLMLYSSIVYISGHRKNEKSLWKFDTLLRNPKRRGNSEQWKNWWIARYTIHAWDPSNSTEFVLLYELLQCAACSTPLHAEMSNESERKPNR